VLCNLLILRYQSKHLVQSNLKHLVITIEVSPRGYYYSKQNLVNQIYYLVIMDSLRGMNFMCLKQIQNVFELFEL